MADSVKIRYSKASKEPSPRCVHAGLGLGALGEEGSELDLGSGEKSWGFKSLLPHHTRTHEHFVRGFFVVCAVTVL
jgi:hypothetical protein